MCIRWTRRLVTSKTSAELKFWRDLHTEQGGRFTFKNPGYYRDLMLGIAGEEDAAFVTDKVVADFGCGPRGSLTWAQTASIRIGIDVLAASYADLFPDEIAAHEMIYVTSTEKRIPLPSGVVDVMFSINALDHVSDFAAMSSEILRVLKPAGLLVASINLDEPPTAEEPQQLTEELVRRQLLASLIIDSYRTVDRHGVDQPYARAFERGSLERTKGMPGFLWVRARKQERADLEH